MSAGSQKTEREPLLDPEFLSRLEKLSLVTRTTILGRVRGERRSRKHGYSTEFADYRDYVPGDDLRYLDWNIFGRLERLFIKLFHDEEDLTVSILLDMSASMADGNPEKLRYACQVAAALGYIALSAEDRVGIYPFDADLRPSFRPVRGKKNALRMFRFLEDRLEESRQAADQEEVPRTDLTKSMATYSRAFARRGMTILISDLLDPGGFDAGLRSLAASRSDAFLVHLLSPQEVDPTLTGDLRLVDCEDGSTTDISINRPLIKAYLRTLQGFRDAIQESCSGKGVTALFASTATPFEHLVHGYLRSRGLVQ